MTKKELIDLLAPFPEDYIVLVYPVNAYPESIDEVFKSFIIADCIILETKKY